MKRVCCFLTVLLGLSSFNAKAQMEFTYGVKVSGEMSNYILKKMPGVDSKMNFGASLGGFVNLGFSEFLSVQPELFVHFNNSKMDPKHAKKEKLEYWGLELPIYATIKVSVGKGKAYLGIGPYIGLGLSLKNTTADIKMYKEDLMKQFDFGGSAMLGYEFPMGLLINARYNMGFIDLVDEGTGKMRTQTLGLGIGYRF